MTRLSRLVLVHRAALLCALVLLVRAAAALQSPASVYPPGLVVIEVTKGSPADRAGIRPGDMLLSFDGKPLVYESQIDPYCDAARFLGKTIAPVTLRRAGDERLISVDLAPTIGALLFPPLPRDAQVLFDLAVSLLRKQDPNSLARISEAAEAAEKAKDYRAAAALWGTAYGWSANYPEVQRGTLLRLTKVLSKAGNALTEAALHGNEGIVARDRFKPAEAEALYRKSLAIQEKLAPNSLVLASTYVGLSNVALDRGQLAIAEPFLRKALAIQEKLAPESLSIAITYHNLGVLESELGMLVAADANLRRALAIRKSHSTEPFVLAGTYDSLGNVCLSRGRLDEAESFYLKALAIHRTAPRSLDLARTYANLGSLAASRGRLEVAEDYYRKDLAITQELASGSLDLAVSYDNLGFVALNRGKLDEAEAFYRRALAIQEKRAPDSLDRALTHTNLGIVAYTRNHLDEADVNVRRALAIQEKHNRFSPAVAETCTVLGGVAFKRGKLDVAERFYRRALMIRQKFAPSSLDVAEILNGLGVVARSRGKLDEAVAFYQRSLAIAEKIAPNSRDLAQIYNNLGFIALARGNLKASEDLEARAWRIVQMEGRQVAGADARQQFGKANAFYCADLIRVQLARRRSEAAFMTLEQGRTQAMLQAMAERSITEKQTPPEVWKAYEEASVRYKAAFKQAEMVYDEIENLRLRLGSQQEQQASEASLRETRKKIAQKQAQFDSLRAEEVMAEADREHAWSEVRNAQKAVPEPLDAGQIRARLAPGMLALEYAVTDKEVLLFAVTSSSVQTFVLPTPRKEFEARVRFVRRIVARATDDRGAKLVSAASDIGLDALRQLYGKLFPQEIQAAIAKAKQVVISPDDFLWDLPFAALVCNASGAPDYLGISKPLSYAQSLALLVTPVPGSQAETPTTGVLVIGNPLYDESRRNEVASRLGQSSAPAASHPAPDQVAALTPGERGYLNADGNPPPPLPGAELEANSVAALYSTTSHLGIEPTEAWFRQNAPKYRILHLATHGFLHPYSSASSGVLLAVPNQPEPWPTNNDGVLQAWEVWDLKLNADLVVLSACETGRGAKVPGEGLVGLTRAWQFAGAKTIVSSQWKVSDESTAALMTAFHRRLLAGAERDEALRLAMAEVAGDRRHNWSEPYHWAAFLMVGETGRMPKW